MFRPPSQRTGVNMRAIASSRIILLCGLLAVCALPAQDSVAGLESADERERVNAIRALAKSPDGFRHLDKLAHLLSDDSEEVRVELVTALIKMRTIEAQPLLIKAAADLSPNVQAMAVDGLVTLYVPGLCQARPSRQAQVDRVFAQVALLEAQPVGGFRVRQRQSSSA